MRHRPDGDCNWIGHYMYHWFKFHVVFPLMRKSAAEVGLNLQNNVIAFLGVRVSCTPTMVLNSSTKLSTPWSMTGLGKWRSWMAGHVTQNARVWLSKATTKRSYWASVYMIRRMMYQLGQTGYLSHNISNTYNTLAGQKEDVCNVLISTM